MKNISVHLGIEISNSCPNSLDLTTPSTFSEVLFPLYLTWIQENSKLLNLKYYI